MDQKKDTFWDKVNAHVAKYGSIDTPQIDFGSDVGAEVIDD
ncbi:Hypothetical protein ADU72_0902 [Pediococcus damnosus]|uniref:Uncharacterized protein n=1 Tax=Pediococcus damnosus TaxID=51663 RepID=A0A143AHB0_9LACO|nr:AbrB family transcriptional regulator [Pediococcus damnosus]AMV60668.1 Hypothetical protein ADU69_1007 [Pediococcus damnosus]AMV63261.1 Hypothetical protein ADU70_1791 [Pediococcus damnosus]AMV64982.1 Hypothetical protein ADU71_1084 [Pediococcus damnosus]AMV66843.1 Hypothetical protein ADU72_0902 [Pediococcus damnosus]AMV69790.1 Hypothetical protein ADU73_1394 [Pediococcus damnosus]